MKRFYIHKNLIIFLLLFVNKGFSQKNYTLKWYTSDNNELPQSSVNAIVQDKYNFIWITTGNGIVRYDGSSFLLFNSSNTKMNGARFKDILGDIKSDSLYCYNESRKEIILINKRRIEIIENKKLYPNIIKNQKRFYMHGGLPSNNTSDTDAPHCIQLSNKKRYFINTKGIELCDSKMNRIYKKSYNSKSVFNYFSINDTLYYLKDNGEYDCFSQEKIQSEKLNSIISKDKFKLFWNKTSNQVFLYSKNTIYQLMSQKGHLSLKFITDFKDFENSNIISIFYDLKNQKLYLGSSTNGLCILSFTYFKTVQENPKKPTIYYSSLPYNDDTFIASDGLIFKNDIIIDRLPFTRGEQYNEKITMAKDAEGIWIVRKMKLYYYLKKSNYKKHIQYDFKQQIKSLYVDSNNTLWINLQQDEFNKAKLYFISKQKKKAQLALTSNINFNCIIQYDEKTLYIGTEKGFLKYEITSKKLHFIKNSENINARNIFIDSNKKIWITTYEKGFFLYSNNKIYSFPKDKNNYLNSSHCIIEDNKGFFWITTNKGLFQVSKQSLLKYVDNKTYKIYYHYYDKKDGFLTNEFNGGCQPCGNYLKNNDIVFPSMNGMVVFNPDKINPLFPNNELFIDKVIVDQKNFLIKDTIVLDNDFQRAKFLIDYPYYGNPNNLNIEVKLDCNSHNKWEKIGANKSISFTTLPPGTCTLAVRSLSDFNSTYKYKTVIVIIPYKFYQTLWFEILAYIFCTVLIIFLWRIRILYLKVRNQELKEILAKRTLKLAKTIKKLRTTEKKLKQEVLQQKRLVQIISHDIKSPLKYLALTVRHLYDIIEKQDDEHLKDQVKSVYTSSQQLYDYVENLVKYSIIFIEGKKLEDESYSLHELIETKILLFKKIALSENTEIINNISQDKFIKTNNKILSIIIHNLIDNAVKYTRDGKIILHSEIKDNKLYLTIEDSGIGMDKELIDYYINFLKNPCQKKFHLGMHMIIELLIILKGEIEIISEINKGTTIKIIVEHY